MATLNKLAKILYRRNRGDKVRDIAAHFGYSRAHIYHQIARARANADVKREAALMRQSGEDQMSLDFGA